MTDAVRGGSSAASANGSALVNGGPCCGLNLELVERARRDARERTRSQRPLAPRFCSGCARPSQLVEVADDRHAARVRRPHHEVVAGDAVAAGRARAHLFPRAQPVALAEEIGLVVGHDATGAGGLRFGIHVADCVKKRRPAASGGSGGKNSRSLRRMCLVPAERLAFVLEAEPGPERRAAERVRHHAARVQRDERRVVPQRDREMAHLHPALGAPAHELDLLGLQRLRPHHGRRPVVFVRRLR